MDDLDEEDSSGSEIGGDRDQDDIHDPSMAEQRLKTKIEEDWNYLKKTMNSGEGTNKGFFKPPVLNQDPHDKYPSQELIDFHEKVDTLLEKEEELVNSHMRLIKENAQLLTKEGELISYVQGSPFMFC